MTTKPNFKMNQYILQYLNSIYPLSPELKAFLVDKIKSCSFDKNEIINSPGEICNRLYLIKKGMVRGYFISDSIEITTWIDTENELFTSITGFFRNQKTEEYMQSLEVTLCDYLEYDDYKYCLEHYPEMQQINRMMMEEYYIMAEHRVYLARIPNAGKRLEFFMKNMKPQIIDRIPKKHLASYLAIRPETLSRLMREKN